MFAQKSRKILAQGDRDSACFLYSLANAAFAVTGIDSSEGNWTAAVEHISRPADYLRSECGTRRIDKSPRRLLSTAKSFLSDFLPEQELQVRLVRPIDKSSEFNAILSRESVLVMANRDHWFCLLEVYKRRAYVACSAALAEKGSGYRETREGKLKHLSNDSFPLASLEFYEPWAIQVARAV